MVGLYGELQKLFDAYKEGIKSAHNADVPLRQGTDQMVQLETLAKNFLFLLEGESYRTAAHRQVVLAEEAYEKGSKNVAETSLSTAERYMTEGKNLGYSFDKTTLGRVSELRKRLG